MRASLRELAIRFLWPFALAAAIGHSVASEAAAPVYKCPDPAGGLMYTDMACKGGEKLDLRAGEANPRAIERLALEQRAASEHFAAQRAAEAFEAAQRRAADFSPSDAPIQPEGEPHCAYCGVGYGYAPLATPPKPAAAFVHARAGR